MSSNIFYYLQLLRIPSCSRHILNDFTWTHCASGIVNTAWFIYMFLLIGLTFLTHPPNKRKVSQTLLHTVFRKHVVQPGNHSKTLDTVMSLNVPLMKALFDFRLTNQQKGAFNSTLERKMKLNSCFFWGGGGKLNR